MDLNENGPWLIPEPAFIPHEVNGEVLVIGIGGSNLRMTLVNVNNHEVKTKQIMSMSIPTDVKNKNFFKWCAKQINPHLINTHLALSFSFPLIRGRIVGMGKGFPVDFNGMLVLDLLNAELNSKVEFVLHDGSSSLTAGLYTNPNCTMALTLGTGVNINFFIENSKTFVNSEICMLGRSGLYDFDLETQDFDFESEFPFECKVGGFWLGKLASKILNIDGIDGEEVFNIAEGCQEVMFLIERASRLVARAIKLIKTHFLNNQNQLVIAYTGSVIFNDLFREMVSAELRKLNIDFKLVPEKLGSEIGCAIASLVNK